MLYVAPVLAILGAKLGAGQEIGEEQRCIIIVSYIIQHKTFLCHIYRTIIIYGY